ncbi:hypothetical protein U91I_01154 [alpha proteobacterium U9-1i]|nr:hypothetical protein U91I_01154 [alpha proteobacterium U9-1i]
MRTSYLAVAAAAALLAGCGLGAPSYPSFGETSYRVEGMAAAADGGASTRTVIYRNGPNMRFETTLPTIGAATIVFDESNNAAYVLNPTGVAATAPAPVAAHASGVTPPATTAATTPTTAAPSGTTPAGAAPAAPAAAPQVIGVAVRIDDADAPQPLEAAWASLGADNARSVGKCEVAGENGHEWTPREPEAAGIERTACITEDGIVLRVRENERVLWEATSLQRGEQDAALFGLPAGYQVIDPQATAEAVGEQMEQLDSVTGAPQTPAAPAPAPRTN